MRGSRILLLAVVASLMLAGVAGTAAADPEVGASGNCDEDQKTDGPRVKISQNDQNLVSPGEVETTANELARFAQKKGQDPQGENACDGEDSNTDADGDGTATGDDYIEAHATGPDNNGVQVCYSDDNDANAPSQDNVRQGGNYDTGYCGGSESGGGGGPGVPSPPGGAPSPPGGAPSPPGGAPSLPGGAPSPPSAPSPPGGAPSLPA